MSSLLIACAMPQELKAICRVLKNVTKVHSSFYRAPTASGAELFLIATGIGPVSAACDVLDMGRTHLLSGVVLLGVGGALTADLQIGDLVVADKIVQHDSCAIFDEGRFLMRPGSYLSSAKAAECHDPFLYTDPILTDRCLSGIKQDKVFKGSILTGAEFSGTTARKGVLAGLVDNGLLVEMEAAGVAQAAEKLQIPYAVAKGVSDRFSPGDDVVTIMDDFRKSFQDGMVLPALIAQNLQSKM